MWVCKCIVKYSVRDFKLEICRLLRLVGWSAGSFVDLLAGWMVDACWQIRVLSGQLVGWLTKLAFCKSMQS